MNINKTIQKNWHTFPTSLLSFIFCKRYKYRKDRTRRLTRLTLSRRRAGKLGDHSVEQISAAPVTRAYPESGDGKLNAMSCTAILYTGIVYTETILNLTVLKFDILKLCTLIYGSIPLTLKHLELYKARSKLFFATYYCTINRGNKKLIVCSSMGFDFQIPMY